MILRNILSNWFALVVLGIVSFILTPILIHGLGEFYFGLWALMSSVAGYYGLMDLGLRATMQRYLARLQGAEDREGMLEVIATSLVSALAVCVVVVAATVVLTWVLPQFFKLHGNSILVFRQLIVLTGINVAVVLPARLMGTFMCGFQRFDLYNLNEILGGVLRAVLIVIALEMGYGVVAVAAVTLIVSLCSVPFLLWLLRKADPEFQIVWRKSSFARARELFEFSFFVSLNSVGSQLRNYTDSIVIGRFLTVALITPFAVAARLLQYFRQIMVGITGPLMPAFSHLDGRQEYGQLRSLFIASTRMTATLSLFIASMLFLNGRSILRFWVGAKYVSSYSLMAVLLISYLVSLIQGPSTVLLVARGRHRFLGILTMCEGTANLILSIIWAKPFGLLGVAFGTTVPMLVATLGILPWYALHVAGISPLEYFRKALSRPMTVIALFAAGGYAAYRVWPEPNLLQLVALLGGEVAVFGLLAYVFCLLPAERRAVWGRAKGFAQNFLGGARAG